MSIIKSSDMDVLRPVRDLPVALWGQPQPSPAPPGPDSLEMLQAELDAQSVQLDEMGRQIEEFAAKLKESFREGEAKGRTAGLAEADERHEERLQVLERGLAQALELFAREVSELERLAIVVSHQALAKVLGDSGDYPDLLTRIIRSQMQSLGAQSAVRVELSGEDFPDAARLAELTEAIGQAGLEVRVVQGRKSGACLIKLGLGGLEVGIDQQWGQLSQLLGDMAEPVVAP